MFQYAIVEEFAGQATVIEHVSDEDADIAYDAAGQRAWDLNRPSRGIDGAPEYTARRM